MTNRERWLRIALIIVGIGFLIGLYPMFTLWESGFRWQPQHPRYEHMITAIYAVLGVFLLRASRNPLEHLSLIWFTVWSSVAHAVVMATHAVAAHGERTHLLADIPLLIAAAALLAALTPVSVQRVEAEAGGPNDQHPTP